MQEKYLLFYDTETTGFPVWDAPDDVRSQPHLVQVAALKVNAETREVISQFDLIVQPNGWDIPEGASAIHGITTEYASAHGVPEAMALHLLLMHMDDEITTLVGHNEAFDRRIINIAASRYHRGFRHVWKRTKGYCTCNSATPILQLPPSDRMKQKNIDGYKKPNLREAYEFFFSRPHSNAHSALANATACMEVYWAIQDRETAE